MKNAASKILQYLHHKLNISFLKKNRDETVNNNLARKYDFREL